MSVMQACADTEAAIAHARSLFGSSSGIDVPNSATEITGAIQTATAGRDRTLEMAGGAGMPAYRAMVDRFIPPLATASTSDAGLTTQLVTAAAVSKAGATQLDAVAAQTRTLSAAAPAARTAAQQRAVLTALRAQMQQASQVVQTTQQQAGAAATQIRSLQYPKDSPASSGDGVQALDEDKTKSPPHGHDPRYWVDVTKIIQVPDGQLAPRGYTQIGPNQWYPFEDNQQNVHPPPGPVKYPLDMHDITHVAPGQVGPWGTSELAPGYFAPDPGAVFGGAPPWSPKQPVDIRDVIQVPAGEKAPWGYKEYLPGWFAPDISFGGPH
jgi:hypothetical protein